VSVSASKIGGASVVAPTGCGAGPLPLSKLGAATVVAPTGCGVGSLPLSKLGAATVVAPTGCGVGPLAMSKLGAATVVAPPITFPSPPIYPEHPGFPELPGLTYDVVRRPRWETDPAAHVSGREVRVGYFQRPIYEWDLIYDGLRDFPCGVIPSELKRLEGFFLRVGGRRDAFLYWDPDDNTVVGQAIGTTSGAVGYGLVRTYGDPAYGASITEPVGWVNLDLPFNVYLDGVLQSPATYVVYQNSVPYSAAPGQQVLVFTVNPGSGHAITVDMSYYFYARFGEDYIDFEKFAELFWLLRKVTLVSERLGPMLPPGYKPC
jgi:hypothetical protein